jgi:hypothetical protein
MSNATSITFKKSRDALANLGRTLCSGVLMALPLGGLVLFFEMTEPAKVTNTGFFATKMASGPAAESLRDAAIKPWLTRGQSFARFEKVSAERRSDNGESTALKLTAGDTESALAKAPFESLKAGFYTEFVTKERRRIALLIVGREPIYDRVVPDNSKLMNFTEASTANVVTFVWGRYLYRAEIVDKGIEADVVVQKVL